MLTVIVFNKSSSDTNRISGWPATESMRAFTNAVDGKAPAGFAPLAPRVDLIGTVAGTATRTLATNNVTNMSVDSGFGGLLSGTWQQNRAVSQLSQRKNCQ